MIVMIVKLYHSRRLQQRSAWKKGAALNKIMCSVQYTSTVGGIHLVIVAYDSIVGQPAGGVTEWNQLIHLFGYSLICYVIRKEPLVV